jgi:hypothetical protein
MPKHLVSGSGLGRAVSCIGSVTLPRERVRLPLVDAAAKRGTQIHRAIEAHSMGARWEDIRARAPRDVGDAELKTIIDNWMRFLAMNDLKVRDGSPSLEVTLVIQPRLQTARFEGAALDRDYETTEEDLPGTLDHVLERATDGLIVNCDVKTGSLKHKHDPYGSWQLRLGSIALWRLAGEPADGVLQMLHYTRDPFTPRQYHATTTDILAWERELSTWQDRALRMRRGEIPPAFVKGPYCNLCDGRHACPLFAK